MAKAHITVGMAAAFTAARPETIPEALPVITGAALGCLICDLDCDTKAEMKNSNHWRIVMLIAALAALIEDHLIGGDMWATFPVHGSYLCFAGLAGFMLTCIFASISSHRGFSHSLLALALETTCIWLVFPTAALPFAALDAHGGVVVYPEYDARIERDYAYAVRVWQGSEKKRLVVYNHCEKSMLTTRTRGGDVNRRFCEFAFDGGPVQVDVAVCEDVKSYAVFPSRLGLKSAFQDGVISVLVDRPCNFGIRLNDHDKTILSVFADAPEDPAKVPKKGDPKVLYVEGWVDPPREDGVTVVADPVKEVL